MAIDYKSELETAQKEVAELEEKLKKAEYLIAELMKDSDNGEQM